MQTISASKICLVQVARKQLRLDDDSYRSILRRVAGVGSSKELCPAGFDMLMEHFEQLGFKSTSKRKPMAWRRHMATPHEIQFIRALWAEYTGENDNDLRLGRWLERQFKISSVRFITAEIAPKAIAALTAMNRKKAEKAEREAS